MRKKRQIYRRRRDTIERLLSMQNLTFSPDECPWFAREHGRGNPVQDNERKQHKTRLDIHILPAFGNLLYSELSPTAIEQWIYKLNYSGQTKKHILRTFGIILKDLKRDRLIDFTIKDIKPPIVRHKQRDVPTDKEAAILFPKDINILKNTWGPRRYKMGIMLALAYSSGMRISELRALRWPAIHWDLNGLVVVTTINRDEKPGAPKAKSVRAIPVPEWTLNMLKTLPGRKKDKTGFVFPGRNPGEPLDIGAGNHSIKWVTKNLLDENKKQIIKSDLSPHGLRHGYNTRMRSILAESGFDQFFDEKNGFQASTKATDDVLRAFTGHKSINMTELYDHPELLKQLKFYDKHFRSYIERFWSFGK